MQDITWGDRKVASSRDEQQGNVTAHQRIPDQHPVAARQRLTQPREVVGALKRAVTTTRAGGCMLRAWRIDPNSARPRLGWWFGP